jgi:hypothetical protein
VATEVGTGSVLGLLRAGARLLLRLVGPGLHLELESLYEVWGEGCVVCCDLETLSKIGFGECDR